MIEGMKKTDHMVLNTRVAWLPIRFRNQLTWREFPAGLDHQFGNGLKSREIKTGEEMGGF